MGPGCLRAAQTPPPPLTIGDVSRAVGIDLTKEPRHVQLVDAQGGADQCRELSGRDAPVLVRVKQLPQRDRKSEERRGRGYITSLSSVHR